VTYIFTSSLPTNAAEWPTTSLLFREFLKTEFLKAFCGFNQFTQAKAEMFPKADYTALF
jgi:hypothetical protein